MPKTDEKTRMISKMVRDVSAPHDNKWWEKRLTKLYDSASNACGASLSIYGQVSQLLDYLDGTDEVPKGLDLFQECDNLASRLRALGGDA